MEYDKDKMQAEHVSGVESMTVEQRIVFDVITNSIFKETGGFFFLCGYGGTGKTFIWNTVSATV